MKKALILSALVAGTSALPADESVFQASLTPDSNWLMSIVLAIQPRFLNQPADAQAFRGYVLFPDRVGNFVPKSMADCNYYVRETPHSKPLSQRVVLQQW
jgi:hypothetical protein